jgi:hypothetical protein
VFLERLVTGAKADELLIDAASPIFGCSIRALHLVGLQLQQPPGMEMLKSTVKFALLVSLLLTNLVRAENIVPDFRNAELEAIGLSKAQLAQLREGEILDCASSAKIKARTIYPKIDCNAPSAPFGGGGACIDKSLENESKAPEAFRSLVTSCMAKRGWVLLE